MADVTMCSTHDCPVAATCRRHEASGTRASESGQSRTTYHWRRHRLSDRVICNGFEPAPAVEAVAHG